MSESYFDIFTDTLKKIGEVISQAEKKEDSVSDDDSPIILTAQKINELKWLRVNQLTTIFKNGKRKVKIDDDPDAYSALKWLSQAQLEAIFGKESL